MFNKEVPKVDIVFTWVDGTDKNWLKKKQQHFPNQVCSEDISDDSRFMSNDELKYALRSIEQNLSWVNHIYIVTDSQCPGWLNDQHSRISIIDHKQIFPEHCYLPTFNSMAIEQCLINIPNLSELFIYCNDDMFFGRESHYSHFFDSEDNPKLFTTKRKLKSKHKERLLNKEKLQKNSAYQHVIIRARKMILERFGSIIEAAPCHVPKPFKKSVLRYLHEEFQEEITETISHRARTHNDVYDAALFSFYLQYKGQKPTALWRLNKPNRIKRFFKLINPFRSYIYLGLDVRDQKRKRLLTLIRNIRPFMFCINDTPGVSKNAREDMLLLLNDLFPFPSAFEK